MTEELRRDGTASTAGAGPAVGAARRTLVAVLAPAALGALAAFVDTVARQLVLPWVHGLDPWSFTVAGQSFLGPHAPASWLVGLAVAVAGALALAAGRGARRWLRVVAGVLGGLALALLAVAVWELVRPGYERVGPFPWDVLAGLAAAVLAGALGAS
ncbi:MAG: hypothetical protein JXB32_22405, partial [Deltaproteobacteria bacterium]|nr:hypothetical protein [Deltaproteobacteria bacterium]